MGGSCGSGDRDRCDCRSCSGSCEKIVQKLVEMYRLKEEYRELSSGKKDYTLGWIQGYIDALRWVLDS